MPRGIIYRIRSAARNAAYDMTVHAVERMAEDNLDIIDVETAILNGVLIKREKDALRGTRYTIHGTAADGSTIAATVGRFAEAGRFLIITIFKMGDQ